MPSSIEFQNISGTHISEDLQRRLARGVESLKSKALEVGLTLEDASRAVAVMILPGNGDDLITIVPKTGLRDLIDNLKKLDRSANKPYPLVAESLIQRCMSELPLGVMRLLFISGETTGTLQVHTAGAVNKEPQANATPAAVGTTPSMRTIWPLLSEASSSVKLERVREEKKLKDVTEKVVGALKKYPKDVQREVLEQLYQENEDIIQLRDAIAKDEEDRARIDQELVELLPGFRVKWEDVQRRARKAPVPPSAKSAVNIEALLMAASYVFDPVHEFASEKEPTRTEELAVALIGYYSTKDDTVKKLLMKMDGVLAGKAYSGALRTFGHEWLSSGFPKLEIGHKLAASLCMTDVPSDIEVLSPWKAWCLVIPPGLFGEKPGTSPWSRMWVRGSEIEFLVCTDGDIQGPLSQKLLEDMLATDKVREVPGCDNVIHAMQSLVKGACLALSNPDDYKKNTVKEKAVSVKKAKREEGPPDFSVSRFMLSAPVQVDVRQHLLDYITGKRTSSGGTGPKVQFFVRGHWRNQAHGPRMSLRKQMRIEGYWKGPEHGAVKLGNYKVKDEVEP